ncbi:MAG: hypothetical protein AB1489_24735 [Acidobacteriota bacterium]
MDVNNLYFCIVSQGSTISANIFDESARVCWVPSQTIYAATSLTAEENNVVVIETVDDGTQPRELVRYCWPAWLQLWRTVIAYDFPEAQTGDLQQYDLSAWDNDMITAIATTCKEVLTGNR